MISAISRKARVFWPLCFTVLLADCATKRVAVEALSPPGTPHRVVGDVVRLTLAYNTGTAMGLAHGGVKMFVLAVVAFFLAGLLLLWYRRTPKGRVLLPAALALVLAGAIGNGWQRLLSVRGVVDFIDLGLGHYRFYVFNVADIGITIGAVLLGLALWRAEEEPESNVPLRSSV